MCVYVCACTFLVTTTTTTTTTTSISKVVSASPSAVDCKGTACTSPGTWLTACTVNILSGLVQCWQLKSDPLGGAPRHQGLRISVASTVVVSLHEGTVGYSSLFREGIPSLTYIVYQDRSSESATSALLSCFEVNVLKKYATGSGSDWQCNCKMHSIPT